MDRRWDDAEVYTSDVLSAMPEEHLTYVAVPRECTFAKHLTHLAYYNVFLLSRPSNVFIDESRGDRSVLTGARVGRP